MNKFKIKLLMNNIDKLGSILLKSLVDYVIRKATTQLQAGKS